jgi:hypothetical protein
MVNRCKRRSLLIGFFLIQFILFSSYTYNYYQNNNNNNSSDQIKKSDRATISPGKENLPASLIEKGDRSELNKDYKDPKNRKSQLKNDLVTSEKLQELNVSFVKDIDQQQTLIQCPLLSTNLGSLS